MVWIPYKLWSHFILYSYAWRTEPHNRDDNLQIVLGTFFIFFFEGAIGGKSLYALNTLLYPWEEKRVAWISIFSSRIWVRIFQLTWHFLLGNVLFTENLVVKMKCAMPTRDILFILGMHLSGSEMKWKENDEIAYFATVVDGNDINENGKTLRAFFFLSIYRVSHLGNEVTILVLCWDVPMWMRHIFALCPILKKKS